MNELIARRAVSDTQKEAKRDAILIGARELFSTTGFAGINMAAIAKRSGLAKGTVYLYFDTKEEIFLQLAAEEIENWFDALDRELLADSRHRGIPEFVDLIVATLKNRRSLVRLITLLHLVLENNVSYDQALAFKQKLQRRSLYTSGLVEKTLDFLENGQGLWLILNMHCFLVGWGQMSEPAPVLEEIMKRPEMAIFRVDFAENIRSSLLMFLEGLKTTNQRA